MSCLLAQLGQSLADFGLCPTIARDELVAAMLGGQLTADDLLRRYCALVFAETGSYEATARRLQLDRRTVRAKIDATLVARLQAT